MIESTATTSEDEESEEMKKSETEAIPDDNKTEDTEMDSINDDASSSDENSTGSKFYNKLTCCAKRYAKHSTLKTGNIENPIHKTSYQGAQENQHILQPRY